MSSSTRSAPIESKSAFFSAGLTFGLESTERILTAAESQLQQEVQSAKQQLREQVATLAVSGAEKILRREVDAKAHADMLNQLKAQL